MVRLLNVYNNFILKHSESLSKIGKEEKNILFDDTSYSSNVRRFAVMYGENFFFYAFLFRYRRVYAKCSDRPRYNLERSNQGTALKFLVLSKMCTYLN